MSSYPYRVIRSLMYTSQRSAVLSARYSASEPAINLIITTVCIIGKLNSPDAVDFIIVVQFLQCLLQERYVT